MGSLGLGNGSLRMDDVYLEGETPDGRAVVGHLSVVVDAEGITFLGPEPGERRTVGWERTSPLEFGPPAALPGGEPVTSLDFVVDGRPLRILVPPRREADQVEDGAPEVPAPVAPAPTPSAEPPAAVSAEPPAAVSAEPPAAALAEPPVPVLVEPPPPPRSGPDVASDGAVIEDTFVVPAPEVGTADPEPEADSEDGEEDWATDDDASAPVRPPWLRYAPRRPREQRHHVPTPASDLVKLVVFTVLVGLVPIAVGLRYYESQGPPARIAGVGLSDVAMAARVGIQKGDLPGWSTTASTMGNPFAAGATIRGSAALRTAEQASTVMARCLRVPVSAVDGAFGMGGALSQVTARVSSPSYTDPAGSGAVSSVVDVVSSAQVQQADSSVFQDPALFATCYQPYVQTMLPYAAGAGAAGFSTATVQPLVVPVPDGPAPVTVAAFQIARIANEGGQTKTVITTAAAVFDGRVQATLGTVSNLVFSLDAQDQLMRILEVRVIGVSRL